MKQAPKIFLSFFILYALFTGYINWNENSRLDLTMAIVDEHRLSIDTYFNNTGDRSFIDGHYYSDKEPGLSLLAVPIYAAYRSCNPAPDVHLNMDAQGLSRSFIQVLLICTILTSALSGAFSVVLVWWSLAYYTKNMLHRGLITVVYGAGTLVAVYSRLFFNHALATCLAFLCFYLVLYSRHEKRDLLLWAGLAGGFAIVTQLSTVVLVLGALILVIVWERTRTLAFISGIAVGIMPLLIYNMMITGSPIDMPYFHVDTTVWDTGTLLGQFRTDPMDAFVIAIRLLIDPFRGALVYSPVLILSLLGFVHMRKDRLLEAWLLIGMGAAILLYNSFMTHWYGGSSFGPRHLVILTPFLMIPMAYTFRKYRLRYLVPIIAISVLITLSGFQWVRDDINLSVNPVQNLNNIAPLSNPLFTHYLPEFVRSGPNSWVLATSLGVPLAPMQTLALVLAALLIIWGTDVTSLLRQNTVGSWVLSALASLFLLKLPILDTSFHWDGLQYVVQNGLWYSEHSFLSIAQPDFGHPPLFFWLIGIGYRVFGNTLIVPHLISIFFACLCLFFTYKLGEHYHSRSAGLAAAILLLFSPLFFAQSGIVQPDIAVAGLTVAALFFFLKKNKTRYIITASALVLTKETGVLLLLALIPYVFVSKEKSRAWVLWPFATLALWLSFYWMKTGNLFYGDHVHYLATWLSAPSGILSKAAYFAHFSVLLHFQWVALLLIAVWIIMFLSRKRKGLKLNSELIYPLLLVVLYIFFCFLYDQSLPRHMLPVMPFLYLFTALAIVSIAPKRILQITAVIALLFILGWSGSRTSSCGCELESNMEYLDMVHTHMQAAGYIEKNHPNVTIFTAWPMSVELKVPAAGYVKNPVTAAPAGADIIYRSSQSDAREAVSLNNAMMSMDTVLLISFERNGKRAELYEVSR